MPTSRVVELAGGLFWIDLTYDEINQTVDERGEEHADIRVTAVAWANDSDRDGRVLIRRTNGQQNLVDVVIPAGSSGQQSITGNPANRTNPQYGAEWPV